VAAAALRKYNGKNPQKEIASVIFTATIRNRNTRMAYARAVRQFFDWCDERRLKLADIEAISVATYIEQLGTASKPTVKQHLAAIRQLFDYLTTGGILDVNPVASVRGPRYVVNRLIQPQ
jgi:site-specific recombinase XerD